MRKMKMTNDKPYEYTDKIIKVMNRKFIRKFKQAGSDLLFMDELNVLRYVKKMYSEMAKITRKYFLMLGKKTYTDYIEKDDEEYEDYITSEWVEEILKNYDEVTMYVFENETNRKAQRFAESMIASGVRSKEVKEGLRYWAKMVAQYADKVTDKAMVQAFKNSGIKKVKWVAEHDERTCHECYQLDGTVFDISNIPKKPHWRCRCWLIPVKQ